MDELINRSPHITQTWWRGPKDNQLTYGPLTVTHTREDGWHVLTIGNRDTGRTGVVRVRTWRGVEAVLDAARVTLDTTGGVAA